VHCGPDGIYVSALGNATGDGPGGVFLIDHETFEVLGRWEVERGPQRLAYDMCDYGRRLHFWDLHKRKHLQEIDFGPEH
jgi:selenium-binding protein 1